MRISDWSSDVCSSVLLCYAVLTMIRCSIGLIIICMLFGRPSLAADLPLPRTPIYDSHSQSYFQLFGETVHPGNWEAARIRAAQKFYKVLQGRLAVVDEAARKSVAKGKIGLYW